MTIWTLSKYRNGVRFITNELKKLYGEPMQKLVKHVYGSYIENNGPEKVLESLLEILPKPVENPTKPQNIDEKTAENSSGTLQKTVQKPENPTQGPNLNTISAPGPNTQSLTHFDSVLDKESGTIFTPFYQQFRQAHSTSSCGIRFLLVLYS